MSRRVERGLDGEQNLRKVGVDHDPKRLQYSRYGQPARLNDTEEVAGIPLNGAYDYRTANNRSIADSGKACESADYRPNCTGYDSNWDLQYSKTAKNNVEPSPQHSKAGGTSGSSLSKAKRFLGTFALAMLVLSTCAQAQQPVQPCVPANVANVGMNCWPVTFGNPLPVSVANKNTTLNITGATNLKASPGRVARVILNTAGGTATSIIDSTGTSVTAANTVLTIPSTAAAGTIYLLDWQFLSGISVVPGTSAVLAVEWE